MNKLLIMLSILFLAACSNVTSSNSSNPSIDSLCTSINDTNVETSSFNTITSTNSETSNSNSIVNKDVYLVIGYFKDNKNNPIKNLSIDLYDDNMNYIDYAITDETGKFLFDSLEEGKYYIQIKKIESDKYNNINQNFNFEISGENYEIHLNPFILEVNEIIWSDLV